MTMFNKGDFVRPIQKSHRLAPGGMMLDPGLLPVMFPPIYLSRDRIYEVADVGGLLDLGEMYGTKHVQALIAMMRAADLPNKEAVCLLVPHPLDPNHRIPLMVTPEDIEPADFPMGKRLWRRHHKLMKLLASLMLWLLVITMLALLVGCASVSARDVQACERAVREQVELIIAGADPRMPEPSECENVSDEDLQDIVNDIYRDYEGGLDAVV